MKTTRALYVGMTAVGIAVLLAACVAGTNSSTNTDAGVSIGDKDFGGVVTGASGPEAGVWVIAETTDLPTRLTKIVVTDERGRYLIPDLPKANYSVWVRGYGLVDSPKVRSEPGRIVNLQAVPAPNAAAAAEYYPPIYWYSMLKIPDKSLFPGTGPKGNGMPENLKSQADWLSNIKTTGCMSCHALGTKGTRTIPKELGQFKSSKEAWSRRIASGQAMTQMIAGVNRLDPERALSLWADWTDRIAAVGWLNRKMYEETGDEMKSQGWSPFILDTNGNGKRDAYVEPNQPADPAKDTRVEANLYSVGVNPVDGSVWGTQLGYPGRVVRIAPGPDPTHTALTEVYEPPFPGYGPRGGDIDRNGVFWASLASGHLGKFERSKCNVRNGPTATGKHCPEGWTLYRFPGPQFKDVQDDGSAEASYYTWVDQYNTFGLGENVPIATGNMSDSYFALVNGKFITLRVPYPMGFFAKWGEGRIDNPNTGWKGRGLWATSANRTVFHSEGGKENRPKVIKFQLRPDPLAR